MINIILNKKIINFYKKIKEAILEGEISNDYEAAYTFMLERALKLGLQTIEK